MSNMNGGTHTFMLEGLLAGGNKKDRGKVGRLVRESNLLVKLMNIHLEDNLHSN